MKHLKYFGGYIITTLVSITLLFLSINRLVVFSKLTTSDIEIANALTSAIITQIIITAVFSYITYHLLVDSIDMYRQYKKARRVVLKHRVNERTTSHSTCTLTYLDKQWLLEEPKPQEYTIDEYTTAWDDWYKRGEETLKDFEKLLHRRGNALYGSSRLITKLRDKYENVL